MTSYLYVTTILINMSFLKFILKNPFRRKNSAVLAIVGIAIGIIVIVALGGITDGLVNTFEDTIHAGGADFQISGKETGDSAYGTNTIDASWTDKIAGVEGVEDAYPIYVVLTSVGDDYMNTLIGIDPAGTTLADISMKEGRIFEDNADEVILGEIYAEDNDYKVGDSIEIDGEDFEVVGIYETGDSNMAGGAFTSISRVDKLMDEEDSISNIYVKVEKGADVQTVADRIDEKYGDDITTITSVMEMEQMADMLNMLQASTWAISLLAIVVGGLGIINTMLMSVFERTREIGVLKAVGWSNRKILTMIVGESLVITIVSAIIGSLIGFLACTLLGPQMGIEPLFTPKIFIQAFSIAIVVGIVGGIYPALKAVRLPPTEALRYE
jgi:putative ABC transport system permease protein